ncbi:MAG TPA: hypothetical protein VGC46_00280 [Allosphingosinicella sp.]
MSAERRSRRARGFLGAALLLAAFTSSSALALQPPTSDKVDEALDALLAGESQVRGAELQRRIEAAAVHPLGSQENPVRAAMPPGQRAYLQRLRCSNGQAPAFNRIGNFGVGVYGNIVDGYRVLCRGATPAESVVYMDMYHNGHVEERPVPGFTILPSRPTV